MFESFWRIIDNDLQRVKPKDDLQNLTLNPLTQTTYIDFVLVHVNKNPFHQTQRKNVFFSLAGTLGLAFIACGLNFFASTKLSCKNDKKKS